MKSKPMSKEEIEERNAISKLVMEQPITQDSDLTGVIKILNEDRMETDDKLPSIDLKTRLHPLELSSIVIHDTIIALDCLPKNCLITTRTKKRLAVSLLGKGREEVVKIVQGERESKTAEGFGAKLKNLFTPNKPDA